MDNLYKIACTLMEDVFPSSIEHIYADEDGQYLIYNKEGDFLDICALADDDFSEYSYTVTSGCTKIVIIPDEYDWVLKIPFQGTFEDFEINDEDRAINYYVSEQPDILQLEIEDYENSDECVKDFLLPIKKIGEYRGIPLYIQKKAKRFYEHTEFFKYEKISKEEEKSINRSVKSWLEQRKKPFLPYNPFFVNDIINYYGENKASRIIEYSDWFDMHEGNYGYLENGRPIVFDYGGYYSDRYNQE